MSRLIEKHLLRQAEVHRENAQPTFNEEECYVVVVDRSNEQSLGVGLDPGDLCTLRIKSIKEDGLVAAWNAKHPDLEVKEGDRIIEINNVTGDAEKLFAECKKPTKLIIKLHKAFDILRAGKESMEEDVQEQRMRKVQIPEEEMMDFLDENACVLNDKAIMLFRQMDGDNQRRVVNAGQLTVFSNAMEMYKYRVEECLDKEKEVATKKGGEYVPRQAEEWEVEKWCRDNKEFIDQEAIKHLDMFSKADQWRIISEGPAQEHMDPVYQIKSRAKRSKELAQTVGAMFAMRRDLVNREADKKAKAENRPLFKKELAGTVQEFFNRVVPGCEVDASQMRCGGAAVQHEVEEDRSKLTGKVKGIDGVVEILKKKYECEKGQRFRVIGELGGPAGIWKLELGKTIPKTHVKEGGWRWVMEVAEVEKKEKPKYIDAPVKPATAPPKKEEDKKPPPKKKKDSSDSDSSSEKQKRGAKKSKGPAARKGKRPADSDEDSEQPRKGRKRPARRSEDSDEDSGRENKKKGKVRVRVKRVKKNKPQDSRDRGDGSSADDSREGARGSRQQSRRRR
eukprot:TRINITY_DN106410_c0_g1_i1.p1 TRINITY_DN106410_c0_g1~~TRINITY_DN106410_c0_g1_i1.p1  ORF type:complete len:563 (+),score=172.19 TRINITY_DN106410_c0_g1_i1:74-1762(+)